MSRISSFGFRISALPAILLTLTTCAFAGAPAENALLVTIDGLRWQEVFSGAEEALMNRTQGGVADTNRLHHTFWRSSAVERRQALLPFFWDVIARQGQLYGNQLEGSIARVTNGRNFTYPGFNEILAGFADDRIRSNAKIPNPNVTVLEWLHGKTAFTNRVVALPNWDVFPYILNSMRSGIRIWCGYETNGLEDLGPRGELIARMVRDITPVWRDMNFDVFFAHAALEEVRVRQPRVIWIAFSETDEWAHEGRYDLYLFAAHRIDRYLRDLWETCQALDQYRGKTALFVTTDHGRGTGPVEWKNHGAAVPGADAIWLAALGPGIRPLGARTNTPAIGQNQVAATLAALLGEDYHSAVPRAGAPIADIAVP